MVILGIIFPFESQYYILKFVIPQRGNVNSFCGSLGHTLWPLPKEPHMWSLEGPNGLFRLSTLTNSLVYIKETLI